MKRPFALIFALIGGAMMVAFTVLAMSRDVSTETPTDQVDVWLTTGKPIYKLEHQTRHFSPGTGTFATKIKVSETITYQRMEGFGAALTDSAAWLIYHVPEITRTKIMSDFFSSREGIGISYVRVPMGASDFVAGTQHYTYDDLPAGMTDTQLISFSINHDLNYIIPVLRQALSINPQLKVMASPWSAPAWMKSPETLYGGSLNMEYCQAYANYFVKFIQAYQAKGITITAVTVQNEPDYPEPPTMTTTYPAMHMEPSEQAYFVKSCLGPAFDQNGIDTKILIWDHNWDGWPYPIAVLNDPAARNYISGSAWHCYCSHPPDCDENIVTNQSRVHDAYPDKGIYFTECTGQLGSNFAVDLVWNFHNLFIGSVRNWAQTVLLWNLALDPNGGPQLGSNCNENSRPGCRGVITINDNGQVEKNVEFYAIGHLSKFVDPGAVRIESSYIIGTLESVAFRNPDQSIVLVVLNPATTTEIFDLQWHGKYFFYPLEPNSVATFKWKIHDLYLPLVLNKYRPPFFQNFESNNGTPGQYYKDIYYADCSLVSNVFHGGSRSLRCRMHAKEDGGPSDTGGTVAIYPSSSDPVDLSSGAVVSVWVYDTQGNNTVQLRLCDNSIGSSSHCSDAVWSLMSSQINRWTEITWPLSSFVDVDRSRITSIQLYEWNDGIYYFHDIAWR